MCETDFLLKAFIKIKVTEDIRLISFKEVEEQMRWAVEEIRSVSEATLPERTAALKPPADTHSHIPM